MYVLRVQNHQYTGTQGTHGDRTNAPVLQSTEIDLPQLSDLKKKNKQKTVIHASVRQVKKDIFL